VIASLGILLQAGTMSVSVYWVDLEEGVVEARKSVRSHL
jgi:hypothetical protein